MQNLFQYGFGLQKNIVVPEPQYLKAERLDVEATPLVMPRSGFFRMLTTVQLDDQTNVDTSEIRKVVANGMLAAKSGHSVALL